MKVLFDKRFTEDFETFLLSEHHAAVLVGAEIDATSEHIRKLTETAVQGSVCDLLVPDGSSISIDQIRKLKQSFSLKSSVNQKRIMLIQSSGNMTPEAQNSLLKLLEEPPEGTKFILLCQNRSRLLPTILSRVRVLNSAKVPLESALQHYKEQGVKEAEIRRMYAISNGVPGKLFLLLSEQDTDYVQAIDKAKNLVSATTFNRLLEVEAISKDKAFAKKLLAALDDVLRAVSRNPNLDSLKINSFAVKRKRVQEAQAALATNVNTKLVIMDVLLGL